MKIRSIFESSAEPRELTEGYTHYWSHKGFSPKGWLQFMKDAGAIAKESKKQIKSELDLGKKGDVLVFNGLGSDGYEDLVITFGPQEFQFVKTNEKPYDPFVVEILKAARKSNRTMKLRSDGGSGVFEDLNEGAAMDVPLDADTVVAKELTPEAKRVFRNMYDEMVPDTGHGFRNAYAVWCVLNALQKSGDAMLLTADEVAAEIGASSQEEWLKKVKDEIFADIKPDEIMSRADDMWRRYTGRSLGIGKRQSAE